MWLTSSLDAKSLLLSFTNNAVTAPIAKSIPAIWNTVEYARTFAFVAMSPVIIPIFEVFKLFITECD